MERNVSISLPLSEPLITCSTRVSTRVANDQLELSFQIITIKTILSLITPRWENSAALVWCENWLTIMFKRSWWLLFRINVTFMMFINIIQEQLTTGKMMINKEVCSSWMLIQDKSQFKILFYYLLWRQLQ